MSLNTEQRATAKLDLKTISHGELLNIFRFDFENGKMYWKNPIKGRFRGKEAGCKLGSGKKKKYWIVSIKSKYVFRAKAIFYAYYGRVPTLVLDHINGDSLDDRISNLREVTLEQNNWNTKTTARTRRGGLPRGVYREKDKVRFRAQIIFRRQRIPLGLFATPELASEAYQAARKKYFGEFA